MPSCSEGKRKGKERKDSETNTERHRNPPAATAPGATTHQETTWSVIRDPAATSVPRRITASRI